MVVRNTFLIVLFAILLSHSVIAQDTTEQSTDSTTTDEITTTTTTTTTPPEVTTTAIPTTTTRTTCNNPDDFPLFNDNTCISRTAYTAIFLTSIILAGISFLMLIGLLILFCTRYSGSNDDNDVESSVSRRSGRSGISRTPSMNGGGTQYASALQNVAGTTPLEGTKQRSANPSSSNNHHIVLEKQVPSSAPYSPATPVPKVANRPANGKQNVNESYELTPRQTSGAPTNPPRTQPSSAPKTTTDLDDPRSKRRTNKTTPNEETETSYF